MRAKFLLFLSIATLVLDPCFAESKKKTVQHRVVSNEENEYPKATFDLSGNIGSSSGYNYFEVQGGVNLFFESWMSWRNAPFYRFGSNSNSSLGIDTSFRAHYSVPIEDISPALMVGAGYRFMTQYDDVPFVETALGINTGQLRLNLGVKLLLYGIVSPGTVLPLITLGFSGGTSM